MTTEIPEMPPILERSQSIAKVLERRTRVAWDRYNQRLAKAAKAWPVQSPAAFTNPWTLWGDWARYAVDSTQRSILFLDTLRRRGNAYHEHEKAGRPPLLHFNF